MRRFASFNSSATSACANGWMNTPASMTFRCIVPCSPKNTRLPPLSIPKLVKPVLIVRGSLLRASMTIARARSQAYHLHGRLRDRAFAPGRQQETEGRNLSDQTHQAGTALAQG